MSFLPRHHKELPVALSPPQNRNRQHSCTIDRKQRANRIEFSGKDFQDDKGEAELREGSANICAFEGPLRSTNLDQFGCGQDSGGGAVTAAGLRRWRAPDVGILMTGVLQEALLVKRQETYDMHKRGVLENKRQGELGRLTYREHLV